MSWDLQRNLAKWKEPNWTIDVSLSNDQCQPSIAVHDTANRTHVSIEIMPCEKQGEHSEVGLLSGDAYVRQNDLIAVFPETSPWRFGYQLDLRILDDAASGSIAIEFWLSIQTSLLDTHPQLDLRLLGAPWTPTVDNCWTSKDSSMGLIVHPLDEQDCHFKSLSEELQMKLFGRFMEKGVIRRMRFRLIVAQKEELASFWQDRVKEFSSSPLPLTT